MKVTLAIVCSLVLVGTQIVLAQVPGARVERAGCACCDCQKTCCCAAPAFPEPRPAPAAPVPSPAQDQSSILAPTTLAWMLPEAEAGAFWFRSPVPATAAGAALYAQNCAWLL